MSDRFAVAEQWERSGRLAEAIAEYGRIAEEEGAADALYRKSLLHGEVGQIAAAIADVEQACAIDPADPYPSLRLGQIATALGRHMAAAGHFAAAVAAAPASHVIEMLVNLTAGYTRLGWRDRAFATARQLIGDMPDWWAVARQTAMERYPADRRAALALLRGRRNEPDQILVRWHLALLLVPLGRLAVARRLCEGLMAELPDSFPAFAVCARIIARQSGPDAAAAFLRAQTAHHDNPEYPKALADLLHEAGRSDEVLGALGALPLDALTEEARDLVATSCFILGRLDEMRDFCRRWIAAAPEAVPPAGFIVTVGAKLLETGAVPARPHTGRIAQFWDKPDVPADVRAVMASWRRFHPHADHILFDEGSAAAFVDAHYGSAARETFLRCHHAAMKADYFRIAWLHHAGGNYADADELCLQPMDEVLVAGDRLAIVASLCGDVPGYVHNYYLGARAGSPVLRFAMAEATTAIGRAAQEQRRLDIWKATGPGLVTRAIARYAIGDLGGAPAGDIGLLGFHQYHRYARTETRLAYKRSTDANWQLAGYD